MLLEDFDYDLPEERIAQTPMEPRRSEEHTSELQSRI